MPGWKPLTWMAMISVNVLRTVLITGCAAVAVAAGATEEEPDTEFLEYLGMWEETDEDWQLLAEDAENEERSDPVPQDEESQELEDDS